LLNAIKNIASVISDVKVPTNIVDEWSMKQEINQALTSLKQDGTLKRIYQQWGLWNDFQHEIGIVDCY